LARSGVGERGREGQEVVGGRDLEPRPNAELAIPRCDLRNESFVARREAHDVLHPVDARETGGCGRNDAGPESPYLNVAPVAMHVTQQLEPPHVERGRALRDSVAHIVSQHVCAHLGRQL
jgi:hypothetical protein